MTNLAIEEVPKPGEWPVDPQHDTAVTEDRIWIDGCFDFTHHGTHQSPLEYYQTKSKRPV